jgi:aquaporin Z
MLQYLVVALAFGVGIAVAMYMVLHNSGGHVNPAVSLGLVAAGTCSPIQALGNIVGQVRPRVATCARIDAQCSTCTRSPGWPRLLDFPALIRCTPAGALACGTLPR